VRWFRAHQVILVVYLGGLSLAALELNLPQFEPEYLTKSESLLKPKTNIADVNSALYPNRAYSLYYRALQASLCSGPRRETQPGCQDRARVGPHEIRELIERSLATGNRSNEMVMYNYAIILLQEKAAPELVDAAIHVWRVNYPESREADPRETYRATIQGSRSGSTVRSDESKDSPNSAPSSHHQSPARP
jgi:hypothetical protein